MRVDLHPFLLFACWQGAYTEEKGYVLLCPERSALMTGALEVEKVLEQCRQLLECQFLCFLPGCPDAGLRHPLLDVVVGTVWPVLCSASVPVRSEEVESLWHQEVVLALCDLALQSGNMFVVRDGNLTVARWRLRSIAAYPVESARGLLGICLLADCRPERFHAGEERLLHAWVSMYLPDLEQNLREQARDMLAGSGAKLGIKQEFVSMVGHELRAPLGVIKGYAGLLQAYGGIGNQGEPLLAPEQQQRYVQAIIEQAGLLEVLVADLLDVSRLQRGELALCLGVVDVQALCRHVMESGQLRADQRAPGKYHLACRVPAHLVPVQADAQRLQQVLLNLLDNAVKYSPQGGDIELEVRQEAGQAAEVAITIRDQGVGIPAHLQTTLFQPFARLQRPEIAHISGAGLGLYITRRLVEAMAGKIEIESCEGCGTNVTIRLPTVGLGERGASEVTTGLPAISSGPEVVPEAGFL
jgi:signal transduction histidine kinase